MKISECTIGTVVTTKKNDWTGFKFYPAFVGHITGFDTTPTDTGMVINVIVRWCDGSELPIHPENIEIYKD